VAKLPGLDKHTSCGISPPLEDKTPIVTRQTYGWPPTAELVGKCEAQGYIRLELGGVVVLAVGLVTPVADGFEGGGG